MKTTNLSEKLRNTVLENKKLKTMFRLQVKLVTHLESEIHNLKKKIKKYEQDNRVKQ